MEQLLQFFDEYRWLVVYMIIWTIGAVLVFFDIRHQKKHPPKAPNPRYTRHLET